MTDTPRLKLSSPSKRILLNASLSTCSFVPSLPNIVVRLRWLKVEVIFAAFVSSSSSSAPLSPPPSSESSKTFVGPSALTLTLTYVFASNRSKVAASEMPALLLALAALPVARSRVDMVSWLPDLDTGPGCVSAMSDETVRMLSAALSAAFLSDTIHCFISDVFLALHLCVLPVAVAIWNWEFPDMLMSSSLVGASRTYVTVVESWKKSMGRYVDLDSEAWSLPAAEKKDEDRLTVARRDDLRSLPATLPEAEALSPFESAPTLLGEIDRFLNLPLEPAVLELSSRNLLGVCDDS
mmetsp:Transcript_18260/g.37246  ORF Transcript_18260/g.37246 Transcript_18260/m.37246 type:complete len:295 (-) Transcript_18260:1488-2372(-)